MQAALCASVKDNDDAWLVKAQSRFGVEECRGWALNPNGRRNSGKHVWQIGCNFLEGIAVYRHLDDDPGEDFERCAGNSIASCSRFLVSGSDDDLSDGPWAFSLLVRYQHHLQVQR